RCLPCKPCAAFDKDVLEGGAELDPMLQQFVTVRLVTAKELDFRIFPADGFQDMDPSWWGCFLSPAGNSCGIFGGRGGVAGKVRDTQIWPLPENVGVKVDRDDGLRVTEVRPDSPAAHAGLQSGDELAAAGGRRLFSQADFRGVLHRGPRAAGSIEVVWIRDG